MPESTGTSQDGDGSGAAFGLRKLLQTRHTPAVETTISMSGGGPAPAAGRLRSKTRRTRWISGETKRGPDGRQDPVTQPIVASGPNPCDAAAIDPPDNGA